MFEKEAKEYADWFWGASPSAKRAIEQAYQKGAEFGYNKVNEWHNLQENPTDLPKCEENEQIIFYVKEWIESIQKYRTHYCLGFYKKLF